MTAHAVGTVAALYRFPVKSMGGEALEQTSLSWHGVEGDRRQAFVKSGDLSSFPWLSARDLPELVRYTASLTDPASPRNSPVQVQAPDSSVLPVESAALRERLEGEHGAPLHLMRLSRGAHDAAGISLVGLGSVRALGDRLGRPLDVRRFRQNVLVETTNGEPDVEDGWIGRLAVFGDGEDAAWVRLLRQDRRCVIVNLDPDSSDQDPAILREIVASRANCLGLYGFVERPGRLRVGDPIHLL